MEKEKTTLQKLNKTTETEKKAAEKNYEKKKHERKQVFLWKQKRGSEKLIGNSY